MSKPNVAYRVESPDPEDGAVVVFGNNYRSIRNKGASRLGFFFDETEYSCRRAKEFDQFSELGFVPDSELLKSGWYVYSEYWNSMLNDAISAEEYQSLQEEDPDYVGSFYVEEWLVETQSRRGVYRCMEEVEDHAYFINEFYEAGEKFKAYVQENYSKFEITDWEISYPSFTKIAKFTFPGSKYGGHIRWQTHEDPIDTVEVYVANGDKEAFDNWSAEWLK